MMREKMQRVQKEQAQIHYRLTVTMDSGYNDIHSLKTLQ